MVRIASALSILTVVLSMAGCGGSSAGSPGNTGGGGITTDVPAIVGVAPSNAVVGSSATTIIVYGSNFENGAVINWNGTALLYSSCVAGSANTPVACSGATAISAEIPASSLATAGSAYVTVSNPNPGGGTSNSVPFAVVAKPTSNTWVRAVSGITVPKDIAWNATRGNLYVSIGSADPSMPNTIAAIDPVAGKVTASAAASSDPDLLSISSDASYLWAGLDGSNRVQRYLLPTLTRDISFAVPSNGNGHTQQAVSLQAAPVDPHAVALIAGTWGYSPTGNGVYVYDDATQRPTYVHGGLGTEYIDWMQWGASDTTIYGNQYTTIDGGGIATMDVNPSGVTLASYAGGGLNPIITQFDQGNGLLYSFGAAYDPVRLTQVGQFDYPGGRACTADSSLGRYFCITAQSEGGTDVMLFQLFVYDLNTYALLNATYFGASAGTPLSSITGNIIKVVRWGNAGLAVITSTAPYNGTGGIFLVDGAAVNPNAAPDVTSGSAPSAYAALSSMTPQAAAGGGSVSVTINGSNFSPDSTACWNCSYLQFRFLPTTYVSPSQLKVTIPLASVPSTEPLEISVFDSAASLFSSNALTFTVLPASGTTQITPLNICGLSAAWDAASQLLYVGTADYDGAYPNSVVAINGQTGTVVKSQNVSPDPIFLSDGAGGEYLYAAYAGATNLTQLALPTLNITATGVLNNSQGGPWVPGDMKAAPVNPHTAAVTLIKPGWMPDALGGVVIFDDGVERPQFAPGWGAGQELFDTLAWSSSDALLISAPNESQGPLYQLQVNSTGDTYRGAGSGTFNDYGDEIHSDFGAGLIYSDDGNVANPTTGAFVGSFNASGLVAPDSSLNRVFILGQTAAQSNTVNYTIQSFNLKTFALVSSIQIALSGAPIELVRWGTNGLAVLTSGGLEDIYANGLGMTYLISDTAFISDATTSAGGQLSVGSPGAQPEHVQMRWKRLSKRELVKAAQKAKITAAAR